MSLKVCTLAVDDEMELEEGGAKASLDSQLSFLVNRGPKHKPVFSPAFKDDAVTKIRGKITVSF